MASLFHLVQSDPEWETAIIIEDEPLPSVPIRMAGVVATAAAAASRWSHNALWVLMRAARKLCRKLVCRCWGCCGDCCWWCWWCCFDQYNLLHGRVDNI